MASTDPAQTQSPWRFEMARSESQNAPLPTNTTNTNSEDHTVELRDTTSISNEQGRQVSQTSGQIPEINGMSQSPQQRHR